MNQSDEVTGEDEITRQSNQLMQEALVDAQSLLGKRDPNALLAVALANSLAALTVEIAGCGTRRRLSPRLPARRMTAIACTRRQRKGPEALLLGSASGHCRFPSPG